MEIKKLKDLCIGKGEYGIAAPAEPFSESKYRYLRITDISDNGTLLSDDPKSVSCQGCEKCILQENDIVFARTGNSTGRAFFYEPKYGELVYAGFLIKFHLDDTKVNPKYMKYYTISQTYRNWVNNGPTGSTRGNMSEGDFADMPVFLPSRKQQDAIVNLFSPLDDKIENNNAIAAELEGMAKDLYDYWFVQFDFPDENGKPYKSSGGKMVWNEELKREIPEGWEARKLGQIFNKILDGISPLQKGEFPYTPMDCLPSKKMSFGRTFDNTEASSSLIKYQAGDVLFGAMRAYFHRVCIAPFDGITRTTTFVLRPQKSHLLGFAYETINQDIAVEYASKHSVGTQQPYAEWENSFASFKFAMPPEELALKYSKIITPSIKMVCCCMSENAELTSLRDFLLPMLMNGQVSVREKPSISNVSG